MRQPTFTLRATHPNAKPYVRHGLSADACARMRLTMEATGWQNIEAHAEWNEDDTAAMVTLAAVVFGVAVALYIACRVMTGN